MNQPGQFTRATAQRILTKLRVLHGEMPTHIEIPVEAYRVIISEARGLGEIDTWEAWRLLFNSGLRGRDLAQAMGWR